MNASVIFVASLLVTADVKASDAASLEPLPFHAPAYTAEYQPNFDCCVAACTGGCHHCGGKRIGHYWMFPCYGPSNMPQHMPYTAFPKTYYYFRPYNFQHVNVQQQQARQWNVNPGLPYSNAIFQTIYEQVEQEAALNPFNLDGADGN